MITPIILPQLGDTMNEGTITRWFKSEGDPIQKGEPLFEVLTDKANIEVEALVGGYLRKIVHGENATVPTGEVIAYVTTTADEPLTVEEHAPPGAEPKGQAALAAPSPAPESRRPAGMSLDAVGRAETPSTEASSRRRFFASPRARRLAAEKGVDLALVTPSSRSGRIVEADVRAFLERMAAVPSAPPTPAYAVAGGPAPSPAPSVVAPPRAQEEPFIASLVSPVSGVRKIIFERMAESARTVARVTLLTEADATRLVEWRDELNARQNEMRFSFTDLLVWLVSRALLKYPYMNATLHEDGIHQHAYVNMGVAVDTERGLLVPVIRDAYRKSLSEIYADVRRLSEAARSGKISPDDLRGGTFTLTNLGPYEVDGFTPIVNVPETAILGVGRIAQKPAAYHGQLALRWMVTLSLAFDHRVVDGAPAARFLQAVKRLVETPSLVLL